MIQYLFRENYKITKKISKEKMKTFAIELPENFDIRQNFNKEGILQKIFSKPLAHFKIFFNFEA